MNHTLRSRQLNPCDELFWKSRGYPGRPQNWEQILTDTGYYDDDDEDEEESYESEDAYTDEEEYYSDEDEEETDSDYEENRLRSLQNNPNNDEYWRARGWSGRPDDWKERIYGQSAQNQSQSTNEWWKFGKNCI